MSITFTPTEIYTGLNYLVAGRRFYTFETALEYATSLAFNAGIVSLI